MADLSRVLGGYPADRRYAPDPRLPVRLNRLRQGMQLYTTPSNTVLIMNLLTDPSNSAPRYSQTVVCIVAGLSEDEFDGSALGALGTRWKPTHRRSYSFWDALWIKLFKRLSDLGVPSPESAKTLRRVGGLKPEELIGTTLVGGSGSIYIYENIGHNPKPTVDGSDLFGISLARVARQLWSNLSEVGISPAPAHSIDNQAREVSTGASDMNDDRLALILGAEVGDEQADEDEAWHRAQSSYVRHFIDSQSVSIDEAAEATGLHSAVIRRRIDERQVAALDVSGELRVPSWQFGSGKPFVDGLSDLLRTFPGDSAALTEWVGTPHPDLGYRTPLTLLQGDRSGEVLHVVQSFLAAAW